MIFKTFGDELDHLVCYGIMESVTVPEWFLALTVSYGFLRQNSICRQQDARLPSGNRFSCAFRDKKNSIRTDLRFSAE